MGTVTFRRLGCTTVSCGVARHSRRKFYCINQHILEMFLFQSIVVKRYKKKHEKYTYEEKMFNFY